MEKKILLIDDQKDFCESVKKTLALHDIYMEYQTDAQIGLQSALSKRWGAVLVDVVLDQQLDGIDILKQIANQRSHIPVIMISGSSTLDTAVKATRMGAYDFLEKPLDPDRLLLVIQRALEKSRLATSNRILLNQLNKQFQLIGESDAIKKILNEVERVAKTDAKVFIWGESGVGKDMIAKIIHYNSNHEDKPFVAINCGAIPENLFESELFGHEKGAFTGANERKEGLIAKAEEGTLFLDEVTEMSLHAQAKLLKFLQDGQYTRVGGTETIQANVRIISATNRDIYKEIQNGTFRQDLFYRLNVVNLYVPPLRERMEDIAPLAEFFLQSSCKKFGKNITHFSMEALELIKEMKWQGNVRQLKSAVERMVLFANSRFIDYGTAATAIQMDKTAETVFTSNTYKQALEEFEKLYFMNLIYSCKGDLSSAAKTAELPEYIIQQKMDKLKIKQPQLPGTEDVSTI